MKCISVRQPWAWLLVTGKRRVAHMAWETKYRGPVFVHANKRFDCDAFELLWRIDEKAYQQAHAYFGGIISGKIVKRTNKLGGIVGRINLDNITELNKELLAMSPIFAWEFSGAEELPFFPMPDWLGFDVDYDVSEVKK